MPVEVQRQKTYTVIVAVILVIVLGVISLPT